MRLDDLVLDLVGTLLLVLLLKRASLFVDLLGVDTNLSDALLSLLSHLLEGTYQIDRQLDWSELGHLPLDSSI